MTSQQIEYVLTLAHYKSFSKAAQKLYVTQPSLSQYILGIEKQLGTSLFDRSTSPIRLTEAGEAFVQTAKKIKALEDNLTNELADMTHLNRGSLKIGASSFRASCLLARSIATFCNTYQGISVSITEDDIDQLKTMVKDGELDVIIGTGNFDNKYFHTEELATERLYLAVAINNPINDRLKEFRLEHADIKNRTLNYLKAKPIDLIEIAGQPFVSADHGEFGSTILTSICQKSGFEPNIVFKVKNLETVFSLLTANLGVSLIPDTLIRFGNVMSHPYYYMLDDTISLNTISLVSRKSGYFTNAATEYCLTLKKLVDIGTWRV